MKLDRTIQPSLAIKIKEMANKDLRLGQMMYCVFEKIKHDGKDPFYIENDELEWYFDKTFKTKESE